MLHTIDLLISDDVTVNTWLPRAHPVTKLKLRCTAACSSVIISSQVLVMAGQLKRDNPDIHENLTLIRALRDSNLPKFLSNDAILFQVGSVYLQFSCSRQYASIVM